MSFVDPQTLTVNAVANSLPRVESKGSASVYSTASSDLKLTLASAYGKRTRRTARVDHQKFAVDPLFPAQNRPYSMSFYVVADVPTAGYSITEQKQIVDSLVAWLSASSGANITKLLGGES